MNLESIIFQVSVIMIGSAVLGTLFLFARQPVIIAYVLIGMALGPSGFGVIPQVDQIEKIAHIGVILLLFLIGLNLQPRRLVGVFQRTSLLTLGTSFVFAALSFPFALWLGFGWYGGLLFSAAMMFSSTVISLKLIPSDTLQHKHTGEIMTSVLLLQDVLAILVILFITGKQSDYVLISFVLLTAKFALLCLLAFVTVRLLMNRLLRKFDVIQEYTFLTTLAWCLLWAEAAHLSGLSYELGAFVAGLSIAVCKSAVEIADHLKPLREFFLILFFFAVGAKLNWQLDTSLMLSALAFGALLVPVKALIFRVAFSWSGEETQQANELSVRLAQASEFSLLVVYAALSMAALSSERAMVIQIATIISFIVSTYWVVWKYPTTIAANAALRRD